MYNRSVGSVRTVWEFTRVWLFSFVNCNNMPAQSLLRRTTEVTILTFEHFLSLMTNSNMSANVSFFKTIVGFQIEFTFFYIFWTKRVFSCSFIYLQEKTHAENVAVEKKFHF